MVLLSFPKKSRESDFFSKFMLVLRVFCYHPYPGLSIFCHVPIFPKKGTTKLILQRITANVLTSAHLRSCSWFMVIYEQWVYIEYKVYIHTNSPTRSHHQLLNQIEWDRSKFDLRVSFETMDKATLIEHGQCRLWLQSQKRESQREKRMSLVEPLGGILGRSSDPLRSLAFASKNLRHGHPFLPIDDRQQESFWHFASVIFTKHFAPVYL